MELRYFNYFRAVAESGSFSKAAALLHMTQPSLSRQVKALEQKLGTTLFERTPRGVKLTSTGVGLQRHLEVLFMQLEQIPEVVSVSRRSEELVRIGAPQGLPHDWATALFHHVETVIPRVRFSLHEATTEEQRQLLQDGLIDVGLIHMDAPELRCVRVLTQSLGVAVPPGSSFARRKGVAFADLDGKRVMAHATGEIVIEEARLRSASAKAGADTKWVFRRFSEHSELIASTSRVDAVLVTEASAARHLPTWKWIPVKENHVGGHDMDIGTWAAWREPVRPQLSAIIAAMTAHSKESSLGEVVVD